MASNKHSADGKIPENGLSSLEKDTSTPTLECSTASSLRRVPSREWSSSTDAT